MANEPVKDTDPTLGITHRDTVTHQVKQHPTHRTIKHRNLPNQWMLQ